MTPFSLFLLRQDMPVSLKLYGKKPEAERQKYGYFLKVTRKFGCFALSIEIHKLTFINIKSVKLKLVKLK